METPTLEPALPGQPLSFIHLGFEGHPWTRTVVAGMLAKGIIPAMVIEEGSATAERRGRWWDAKIRETSEVAPPVRDQIAAWNSTHPDRPGIGYHVVGNHNGDTCLELLKSVGPQLITIGTTRILSDEVLAVPMIGTLNCHPALLPGYRGSLVFVHHILDDAPTGVTCHWCETVTDAGDIFSEAPIPVERGWTLSHLMNRIVHESSELMCEALVEISRGNVVRIPQGSGARATPCFTAADDELIRMAEEKLAAQTYRCYPPESPPSCT